MRTVQDAAILMAQFAQFGLAQSIIRYFPRFSGQSSEGKNFINLILVAGMAAFAFFLVIFFLFEQSILNYFRENATDFIHYSGLALWLTFITVMTTLFEMYSRSLLKNILPNLLKEIVVRLLLAVIVLLYFMDWLSLSLVMICSVLVYVFCLLILLGSLIMQGHLQWRITLSLDPALSKELIRFSILSFAGTAGLIIIGKVDSLMIAGMLGLAPVAIYTTSFYMATVIEVPKRAMTQVAAPLISRGFEKNDTTEIQNIYSKTALNQFIVGSLLLIGVAANLDSIFLLMPKGEIYETGKWVVIIVGAGKLVDMLFGPSSEIIVYSKYYSFNIVLILLLAGMIITANNMLIPAYGIEGAAMGAALTLVIFNFIKFVFIWVKLGFQPFSPAFIKVILIAGVAWTANGLMPRIDIIILDMGIRSIVITVIFGSLVLWTRISPESNALFNKGMALLGKK